MAVASAQQSANDVKPQPRKVACRGYDEKYWCTLGGVGSGAILGYLARHYLDVWIGQYYFADGGLGRDAILVREILPNAVGCFVMGLFVELRTRFQPAYPAMYTAITTGFCGCCTTFSSYNTAVARILLKTDGVNNFGERLICAILAYILGMMTAWCSLQFGRSLTRLTFPALDAVQKSYSSLSTSLETNGTTKEQVDQHLANLAKDAESMKNTEIALVPNPPPRYLRCQLMASWMSLLGLLVVVVALAASSEKHVTKLLVSVSLAPLGAWIRFILGLRNPGCTVPWYTMLCNLSAAALSAALFGILDQDCFPNTEVTIIALMKGISSGFCGSLSTVSTLCDETRRLGEKNQGRGWAYVMATILGGQVLSTIVVVSFFSARDCW